MEKSKSNQSNDSILAEKSKEDDETQPDDQSGLLTRSDNVEDAMLDECENLGTESENEKSIEERLRFGFCENKILSIFLRFSLVRETDSWITRA